MVSRRNLTYFTKLFLLDDQSIIRFIGLVSLHGKLPEITLAVPLKVMNMALKGKLTRLCSILEDQCVLGVTKKPIFVFCF